MTEDNHDELAAIDLSTIEVALTPSWLVWILTVMPGYIFHHPCYVFENGTLYTIQVSAVFDFLLPYVNLQSNWAWKPLELGLSICSLVPKFHFQLTKEKLGPTYIQMANGVTASAQLYALYSHRARSFNQWQYVLYPNFIIKTNNRKQDCSCAKKEGAFWNEQTNKTTSKYAKKKISMIITITRQVEKLNMTLD